MRFLTSVHVGGKNISDSEISIAADTVFSALCHAAALALGEHGLERLVALADGGALALSDALPYLDCDLYAPKPITRVERGGGDGGDEPGGKKAFKNLKYVPVNLMDEFMSGDFDAATEACILDKLGTPETRTRVALRGPGDEPADDPMPYCVGSFRFADNAGLYVIAGLDGGWEFLDGLFEVLSYSGIGGKRGSGLGRFTARREEAGELGRRLKSSGWAKYMTLGVSMARPDELGAALDGATYHLARRCGFVLSPDYSDKPLRKRDFYSFAAGSCFANRFGGGLFDVSRGGRHPVYRYARPMFMGLSR